MAREKNGTQSTNDPKSECSDCYDYRNGYKTKKATMEAWKSKFHRIVSRPLSHRWLKNIRKTFQILVKRLFQRMPKV